MQADKVNMIKNSFKYNIKQLIVNRKVTQFSVDLVKILLFVFGNPISGKYMKCYWKKVIEIYQDCFL